MTTDLILAYPNPKMAYKLYTDASDIVLGAVLTQDDENGNERPICFLSRKLQDTEKKYNIAERELLAIVFVYKKCRKYLYDKEFTLFTDSSAIRYAFTKTQPNIRLHNWILAIQEYPCATVKHLRGKSR